MRRSRLSSPYSSIRLAMSLGWPKQHTHPLILPLRFEAEGVLAVHRADRVPVQADVTRHRVGVAPGALHRVFEMQPIAAGRGVQRLDRLHRQLRRIGLVAPGADAVGDGDLLAARAAFPSRCACRSTGSARPLPPTAAASARRNCTVANSFIRRPPPASAPRVVRPVVMSR